MRRTIALLGGILAVLALVTSPAVAGATGTTGGFTAGHTDQSGQRFSWGADVRAAGIEAAHFDWQIDFNTRVESRRYGTPNFGTHTFHFEPGINCKSFAGPETFTLELWAEAFPKNRFLRSTTVSCQYGGDRSFDGISPDPAFYFVVMSNYGGYKPNRIVGGTTFYP